MGQQYARADQPVIGRVEQGDRDLVRRIVADPRTNRLRERIKGTKAQGATRITCRASFADWEKDMARVAKALELVK